MLSLRHHEGIFCIEQSYRYEINIDFLYLLLGYEIITFSNMLVCSFKMRVKEEEKRWENEKDDIIAGDVDRLIGLERGKEREDCQ